MQDLKYVTHVYILCCTGRFGFQKDMKALSSLGAEGIATADGENVTALLRSTNEVERRLQVSSLPSPMLTSQRFRGILAVLSFTLAAGRVSPSQPLPPGHCAVKEKPELTQPSVVCYRRS